MRKTFDINRLGLVAVVVFSTPAAAQSPLSPDQRTANQKSFDHVWSTVKDKHWDATLGGLNWDAVRDEFRPRMIQARTMNESREVLRAMLGRLDQSHFEIHPADVYGELASQAAEAGREGTCGIDIRVIDGQAIVTRVAEHSPAEAMGVRPGWCLKRIDGKELAPTFREIEERYRSSTLLDSELAWSCRKHLSGRLGRHLSIDFIDGDDRTKSLDIPLVRRPGIKVHLVPNLPSRFLNFQSQLIRPDIGYITFNAWADPPFLLAKMEETRQAIRNPDGILIDLRGTRGGQLALAPLLAGYFTKGQGLSLGMSVSRQGGRDLLQIVPRSNAYLCPLAILVDGLTRSTSEIFASGLQQLGRAHIVGSRTAGAVQGSLVERLPNGDSFQFVVTKFITTTGEPLEGVGVTPDEIVHPKREDFLEGRDPILEAALKWVRSHKKADR